MLPFCEETGRRKTPVERSPLGLTVPPIAARPRRRSDRKMSLFAAVHESGCGTFGTHGATDMGLQCVPQRKLTSHVQGTQSDVSTRCRVCSIPQLAAAKVSKSNFRPRERKFRRHFKGNAANCRLLRLGYRSPGSVFCHFRGENAESLRRMPDYSRFRETATGDWFRSPLATCFPKRSIGRASKTPCPKCFVRAGDRIQQRLCPIDFVRTTGASHSGKTRRRGGRWPI
jgi:hypothetical protein